jgi:HK97 family phage major capsid protein
MSINSNEVIALREARAKAHADALALVAKHSPLTNDEKISFERAMSEVDRLGNQIQQAEASEKRLAPRNYASENAAWQTPVEHLRHAAFMKFIRNGKENLSEPDKLLLERRDVAEGAPMLAHIGTYTGLGYFVPTGFRNEIENATKYYCPFLDDSVSGCTVMKTATGAVIPMPTNNDTAAVATIVGEAASTGEQDVTASQINLAAYKFSSGLIKVSNELLQDSAFDLTAWLSQKFGERFGRAYENYLTNGTGSSQPTGILTAIAASGATAVVAAGSNANDGSGSTGVNSIGYDDLVTLEHSVDPSYRNGARFMLHDLTLSKFQQLLDKYGRPLWVPGMAVNAPDTLLGYPYVINQQMPQIGSVSEATTVVFGQFSKFIVRKVQDMTIQRLNELYAINGQVGFISFERIDSVLLDAGTHPLNVLQQHS